MKEKTGRWYLLSPSLSRHTTLYCCWGSRPGQAGTSVLSFPFEESLGVLAIEAQSTRAQRWVTVSSALKRHTCHLQGICAIMPPREPQFQACTSCEIPSSWGWPGSSDLLLTTRIWQKWQDLMAKIRLQKGHNFCLRCSPTCFLWWRSAAMWPALCELPY